MKSSLVSGLSLLLASCNLAPKYSPPSAPTPSAFKESAGPAIAENVGWKIARPSDDAIRTKWWELYGDLALNQLEEEVQVSNQTLIADEASYRQARALVVQARSALFPTVTTSPSYTTYRSSSTLAGGGVTAQTASNAGGAGSTGGAASSGSSGTTAAGHGQIYSLPIEASYEVDLWGRIRNTVAANVYNAQASGGDLANARLSIQAQLAQDYFEVRALDEERRVLDATVSADRRDLDLTVNLYRNGIDSDIDLAQARAQLDTAIAQATDLGTSRAQYEHAIAVLIGKAPANFSLPLARFSASPPPVPVVVPSLLLERRPDVAAAERLVAAANAQVGVARAAYYPTLELSATGGFESSHFSQWLTWPSRFWSLGPQAAETLFDWGERRGENEQAEAAYDQAVANYRQTVLTAFQSVEDNLANLRILAEEVEEYKTAVNSSRHYLNLALTLFKNGIDSYLNVTTAQTALLSNEENAVQAHLRQMLDSVSLVMALGGGWEASDLPSRDDLLRRPPKWSPAKPAGQPNSEPIAPPNPPPLAGNGGVP